MCRHSYGRVGRDFRYVGSDFKTAWLKIVSLKASEDGNKYTTAALIALAENRLFVTMCKLALSISFSLSLQT